MNTKLKSGVSHLSAEKLVTFSRNVTTNMENNSFFPAPPVAIATVVETTNELDAVILKIAGGHIHLLKYRDELVKKLRGMLSALCAYCNVTGLGDVKVLETAGFPFAKDPSARMRPDKVQRVAAVKGDERFSVRLSWKGVKGRNGYIIECSYDPANPRSWKEVEGRCSKTHYTARGLEYGQEVSFRVAAYNNAGVGEWSNNVAIMVG
jgi:hypothetical protein